MLTYEERLDEDLDWALREGSMHFEERNAVHQTLRRITRKLDELGIDYALAGGMALFLHGFRRFTEDVDLIVTREDLARIQEALHGRGYIRPFEASKNLRDTQTGVKIDFIISGQYPGEGTPGPIPFPEPSQAAENRDGIKVLDLKHLIELKLASGQASHRLGDLDDVQKLILALDLPKDFAEQIHESLRPAFVERWDAAQRSRQDDY